MAKADNQIDSLEIIFYSNDHEPEHFHARKPGEWEIRVYFRFCTADHLEYEEKWTLKSAGPSKKDRERLCDYVQQHRNSLEHEWETKVCQD